MRTRLWSCILFLTATAPVVRAQPNAPHLAYVYPAGGRQGATVEITVGGQFLGSVSNAYVTGSGIDATVVEYNRPMNQKEFMSLRDELRKLQEKRRAAQSPPATNMWTVADQRRLAEIRDQILKNPPNRRGNPAMAETLTLRVVIATNAEPGERELRVCRPNALSNPLRFCIGTLPEFSKPPAKATSPELVRLLAMLGRRSATGTPRFETRIELPAVANGQIMPGGVDRYRFTARKGQQLVIRIQARSLIPYLADAVPGWFEATLTLRDGRGNELAYDDRYHLRPDPLIHFVVPHDGEYTVEIRDSIYRGREDFVYRMTLGELPFVTGIYPLGGPAGESTRVELSGWNLARTALSVDNGGKTPGIYELPVDDDEPPSTPVYFAVDTLADCLEAEPNDSPAKAQTVSLPIIVNGRISQPGDHDVFRFEGHAGECIVAEVYARRLGSVLDSSLKLLDTDGRELAFNDDYEDEGAGLETHHADSYLSRELPRDGTYYIEINDVQHQGGADCAYRLRLSKPRPDFALRVVPSSINVRPGLSVPVTVCVLRKDGFTNAVALELKSAPPGCEIGGGYVPENQDRVRFTLKAPPRPGTDPFSIKIEGSAIINGRRIFHDAVPADDMMQAFAYRHLVPARELAVMVARNSRPFGRNALKILSPAPLIIPAGGSARVQVSTPTPAFVQRFALELDDPPEGIAISSVSPIQGGVELAFECDAVKSKPYVAGNLIINLVPKNVPAARPNGRPAPQRRNPVGTLPAIPFEIVKDASAR